MFRFYIYYLVEDIPSGKVGEYMNARKLYQVEDLKNIIYPYCSYNGFKYQIHKIIQKYFSHRVFLKYQ